MLSRDQSKQSKHWGKQSKAEQAEEDCLDIGSLGELVSDIPSDLIVMIPQIYLHIMVS